MEKQPRKASVVYCSPSGGTKRVAEIVGKTLEDEGIEVLSVNLARRPEAEGAASLASRIDDDHCLFVGSPVYVSHPVPSVMDFLSGLPKSTGSLAVPFVTWGGACSGTALLEMAEALENKGFQVTGAAKVLSLHSMMWQSDDPLGAGHPDESDDAIVVDFVRRIVEKWKASSAPLPLEKLAYYPEDVRAEMAKHTIETVRPIMPVRTVNEDLCTQCGVCSEVCPTDSVDLSPYPEFRESCIQCYNCARECPEKAIEVDLSPMEGRIRARAKHFDEEPPSQVFL